MALTSTIGIGGEAATRSVHDQLTDARPDRTGFVFRLLLLGSLGVSLLVLAILFYDVVTTGAGVFTDRAEAFLSGSLRTKADAAGVFQAIRGTFWIGVFVVVFSFPIGVASAVYLEEYSSKGRLARFLDVNIRNLAGVPSIVYGILGLTIFVEQLSGITGGRSLMSAGITLAILVLPIVIITSAEAVRAVPQALREAAYGVGATRWEVTRGQVLPYALPGIITGTVLALARAIGEAAPLLLCGAVTGLLPGREGLLDPSQLQDRFTALPIVIAEWARNPRAGFSEIAAAAIIVMLVIVLAMNTVAILLRNRYETKRS
ncbi:MAG: phosphate ABC transporter permease PstA [Acidimicrobiales bacterium]|nr:phosphate ABC transporter permease PstA [Acidimicrobiales bacterium]